MRCGPAALALLAIVQPARASDLDFRYTYPPAAARIAPLRAWLESDKAQLGTTAARDAAQGRAEAIRSGYPFRRYEAQKEWKVVTDTPRFLSLSAETYFYTGGAHGGTHTSSLLWDKAARRRLAPIDLFSDASTLWAAVQRPFCTALKAEQRRRLDQEDVGDTMHACPPFARLVLLIGSSDGRRFDRIGLVADQYVAGSYAEGIYDIALPVTPAVLKAVRPAYRRAFTPARPLSARSDSSRATTPSASRASVSPSSVLSPRRGVSSRTHNAPSAIP